MSQAHHHHIMIGDTPWCDWTGCQAGRDIQSAAGNVQCGHVSRRQAGLAAKALRQHFRRGLVHVVKGHCANGANQ